MGNCTALRRAAESWADDGEWEEEASSSEEGDHRRHHHEHHGERREVHHDSDSVTIRISKRQLHELMEKNNGSGHGGLPLLLLPGFGSQRRSAEQLLADIMNSGEVHHRDRGHHREREEHWHWKPALQSIPEAVESS